MFTLNKKKKYTVKTVEVPAMLHFCKVRNEKGTESILCTYVNGKRYQEYFNFKNGTLTPGSFLDFKRLCDFFEIPMNTRYDILDGARLSFTAKKCEVVVDFAGFMKFFKKLENN